MPNLLSLTITEFSPTVVLFDYLIENGSGAKTYISSDPSNGVAVNLTPPNEGLFTVNTPGADFYFFRAAVVSPAFATDALLLEYLQEKLQTAAPPGPGGGNIDNGTADGQVPSWDAALAKYIGRNNKLNNGNTGSREVQGRYPVAYGALGGTFLEGTVPQGLVFQFFGITGNNGGITEYSAPLLIASASPLVFTLPPAPANPSEEVVAAVVWNRTTQMIEVVSLTNVSPNPPVYPTLLPSQWLIAVYIYPFGTVDNSSIVLVGGWDQLRVANIHAQISEFGYGTPFLVRTSHATVTFEDAGGNFEDAGVYSTTVDFTKSLILQTVQGAAFPESTAVASIDPLDIQNSLIYLGQSFQTSGGFLVERGFNLTSEQVADTASVISVLAESPPVTYIADSTGPNTVIILPDFTSNTTAGRVQTLVNQSSLAFPVRQANSATIRGYLLPYEAQTWHFNPLGEWEALNNRPQRETTLLIGTVINQVLSIRVPTGLSALITFRLIARKIGGTVGPGIAGSTNAYERTLSASNVGGTITLGPIQSDYTDDATLTDVSIALGTGAGTVQINVTQNDPAPGYDNAIRYTLHVQTSLL